MAATPYMGLTLPTVSVTAGPLYATENNSAFTVIDSHNHTSGQGAQIPTLGISLNADLTFATYNAIQLRSTRYVNAVAPLALASDLNCVYFSGGELYANDASGNQVKITASGSVNVSGSGNITGMGATTATVAYSAISQTFTFSSNTNVAAFLDCASVSIHTTTASSAAITLASGVLTSGAYTLTLPGALPASQSFVTINNSGTVATPIAYANGITASNIASGTITATQIASGTITGTQITSNLVIGTTLKVGGSSAPAISYPGTTVGFEPLQVGTEGSLLLGTAGPLVVKRNNATASIANYDTGAVKDIVVGAQAGTNGLMIIRGNCTSAGVITSGEGFTVVQNSGGVYTISFTTAFLDAPGVVVSVNGSTSSISQVDSVGSSSFVVRTFSNTFAVSDRAFCFVAVGQRSVTA